MKFRVNYSVHTSFLTALFLIGNSVITLPFYNAEDEMFLGYIIASIISFAFFSFLGGFIEKIFCREAEKAYKRIIFLIFSFFCFFEAVRCFYSYIKFASHNILESVPSIIIAIIFAGTVVYLTRQPSHVVLKFSYISFIVVAVFVVAFFFMSAKDFRTENIFLFKFPSIKQIFSQTLPLLSDTFLPVIITLVYQTIEYGRIGKKQTSVGITLGIFVLGLTILNSILLFGVKFSATLDFPYASAISTVTVGYLFSRMDGFSYFIYFACCLVKTAVCLSVGKSLFKRSGIVKKNPVKS